MEGQVWGHIAVAGQHNIKRHLPLESAAEQDRQPVFLIGMFMFINRKLFPSTQVREDVLPFSLVWDTLQRDTKAPKESTGKSKCHLVFYVATFYRKSSLES